MENENSYKRNNYKDEKTLTNDNNSKYKFNNNDKNFNLNENKDINRKEKDNSIVEDIKPDEVKELQDTPFFESGLMESNYIVDIPDAGKLKGYLYKMTEIYDDEYMYDTKTLIKRLYIPLPDPNQIFEFCANILLSTKMEKEVIIISLIYIERFIFNTGILINSRNWKRLIFISLVIASKVFNYLKNRYGMMIHLKIITSFKSLLI